MNPVTKWITVVEYYDMENGEQITKSEYEQNYYKVKLRLENRVKDGKGTRTIIKECRRNGQLRIF